MKKQDKTNAITKQKRVYPLFFLVYCIIGVFCCLITSFILSLLVLNETIQITNIQTFTPISIGFGAFISCILTSKQFGKTLVSSFVQSIVYFALLYITGSLLYLRFLPKAFSFYVPISCFTGALIGAIFVALFSKRR